MIYYCVQLVGVDHVGIAWDGLFSTKLAKILAAITDDLWARCYPNEDLAKIYGNNKMRIHSQVWEGNRPSSFLRNTLNVCVCASNSTLSARHVNLQRVKSRKNVRVLLSRVLARPSGQLRR